MPFALTELARAQGFHRDQRSNFTLPFPLLILPTHLPRAQHGTTLILAATGRFASCIATTASLNSYSRENLSPQRHRKTPASYRYLRVTLFSQQPRFLPQAQFRFTLDKVQVLQSLRLHRELIWFLISPYVGQGHLPKKYPTVHFRLPIVPRLQH